MVVASKWCAAETNLGATMFRCMIFYEGMEGIKGDTTQPRSHVALLSECSPRCIDHLCVMGYILQGNACCAQVISDSHNHQPGLARASKYIAVSGHKPGGSG